MTLVSITSTDRDDAEKDGGRNGDSRGDRDDRNKKDKVDRKIDIQDAALGTDDRTFKLRAEKPDSRIGIIYTIVYRATDAAGNKTEVSSQVIVPPDRKRSER